MTTIAFDGKLLVGDRRLAIGNTAYSTTKIRRTEDGRLIGAAGDWNHCARMLDWLAQTDRSPTPPAPDAGNYMLLEVRTDGTCHIHDSGACYPAEGAFCAIGSGRNYALAALALGHSAVEAVQVASRFDTASGNGIDVLPLVDAVTALDKAA